MFQKGQSGNPSGRPKSDIHLRDLARQHTQAAVDTLVLALKSENDRTRVAAAEALLDRGYGKPQQNMDITHHKSPLNDLDAPTLAALADALRGEPEGAADGSGTAAIH